MHIGHNPLRSASAMSEWLSQSHFDLCPIQWSTKWDTGQCVDLSTADSNKWLTLLKAHLEGQKQGDSTASDHQLLGSLRQRQRRLTDAQVTEMAEKYQMGATVYELAAEYGCHRTTVAERLKKAGIAMRGQSPTPGVIKSVNDSVSAPTLCGMAC
jgi:hypothetical protein